MTIGIAAKSLIGSFIVSVSDMRLALGNAIPGMDSLVKLRTLADRWEFLFAADDIGLVRPIAELARQRLRPFSDRADASHIIAAIESAYQTVRSNVIFNRYIRQYGYKSMDDFKEKPGFNAEIISSLMREIDSFDLGVQLLVYGFDDKGHAHFLEVRNPGEAISRDDLDFWAIGSGFRMAMATLTSRSTQSDTLEAMIYRCCEAKFVSEYAQDVGKTTSVYVKDKEGNPTPQPRSSPCTASRGPRSRAGSTDSIHVGSRGSTSWNPSWLKRSVGQCKRN